MVLQQKIKNKISIKVWYEHKIGERQTKITKYFHAIIYYQITNEKETKKAENAHLEKMKYISGNINNVRYIDHFKTG